jgi:hypothetical protein
MAEGREDSEEAAYLQGCFLFLERLVLLNLLLLLHLAQLSLPIPSSSFKLLWLRCFALRRLISVVRVLSQLLSGESASSGGR